MEGADLIIKYFSLLPTQSKEVGERLRELTNQDYRHTHAISALKITSYTDSMPNIDPTERIPKGLEFLALRKNIVRAYTSEGADGTKMGFEYATDVEEGDGEVTLKYILIDDGRKYLVKFESKKTLSLEEDQ